MPTLPILLEHWLLCSVYDMGLLKQQQAQKSAPVELELGAGSASLQLGERLGQAGEHPQDEHRIQDRHRQHKNDARCGCQVINGAHVGDHVKGSHRHKVRHRQRDDLQ